MAKVTIPNKILIGHKSKNGRYYTKRALEAAAPTANGKKIFINHKEDPKARRKFEDLIGTVTNAHYDPRGLVGDLELDDSHVEVKRIKEIVDSQMPLGGISCDVDFTLGNFDGKSYVVSIDDIHSFDFVAEPACAGILESEEPQVDPQIEAKVVEMPTMAQFNDLLGKLSALESKLVAYTPAPQAAPPVAPLPPTYTPTPQNIDQLIRNCR